MRDLQNLAIDSIDAERLDIKNEVENFLKSQQNDNYDVNCNEVREKRSLQLFKTLKRVGLNEDNCNTEPWYKFKQTLDPAVTTIEKNKQSDNNNNEEHDKFLNDKLIKPYSDTEDSDDHHFECNVKIINQSSSKLSLKEKIEKSKQIFSSQQSLSTRNQSILGKKTRDNFENVKETADDGTSTEEDEEIKSRPVKQLKLECINKSTSYQNVNNQSIITTPQHNKKYNNNEMSIPNTPTKNYNKNYSLPLLESCLIFVESIKVEKFLKLNTIILNGNSNRLFEYVGWNIRPNLNIYPNQNVAYIVLESLNKFGIIAALKVRQNYLLKEYSELKFGRILVIGYNNIDANTKRDDFKLLWDSNYIYY